MGSDWCVGRSEEALTLDGDNTTILVVDDDSGIRAIATETFELGGYQVSCAADGQEASALLAERSFVAAVVDLVLPDCNGLDILGRVRAANPDTVMVVITGYASLDSAMEAVRLGAYDYMRKPFSCADLLHVVQRGIKERALALENRKLLAELDKTNRELLAYHDRLESQMQVVSEKLEAFIELGKRLASADGALPSLADVVEAAMQVGGAASGAVFTIGEGGFDCIVARGEARADLQSVHLQSDEAALASALSCGEAVVVADLLACGAEGRCNLRLLGLASAIVLPLQYQGVTLGLMGLFDWEPGSFAEGHLNLLRVLGVHAAGLLVRGRLQGRVLVETHAEAADGGFVDIAEMLE